MEALFKSKFGFLVCIANSETTSTQVAMAYNPKITMKNSGNSEIPLDDEERKGLLSNSDREDVLPQYEDHDFTQPEHRSNAQKKGIIAAAAGIITLLLCAAVVRPLSRTLCTYYPSSGTSDSELLSNGTHDFKRTVLMVSIDGLRLAFKP